MEVDTVLEDLTLDAAAEPDRDEKLQEKFASAKMPILPRLIDGATYDVVHPYTRTCTIKQMANTPSGFRVKVNSVCQVGKKTFRWQEIWGMIKVKHTKQNGEEVETEYPGVIQTNRTETEETRSPLVKSLIKLIPLKEAPKEPANAIQTAETRKQGEGNNQIQRQATQPQAPSAGPSQGANAGAVRS